MEGLELEQTLLTKDQLTMTRLTRWLEIAVSMEAVDSITHQLCMSNSPSVSNHGTGVGVLNSEVQRVDFMGPNAACLEKVDTSLLHAILLPARKLPLGQ